MKIWMLTNELPRALCGGIARYCDRFATALAEAGHAVEVIGLEEWATERAMPGGYRRVAAASREYAPREPGFSGPLDAAAEWPYNSLNRDFAVAWEMAEVVAARAAREGAPDIIEVPEYKALGIFIKQRQLTDPDFLPGVKVVVMLHTPEFVVRRHNQEPTHTLPQYWVGQQEKAAICSADGLCAPSQFIAEEMRRLLGQELAIEVCPLPLPVAAEAPPAVAVDHDEVLFFGRLEARKGVLLLVEAMVRRWRRGEGPRLTLLGPTIWFPPRGQTMAAYLERKYGRWIASGHLLIIPGLDHDLALERVRRAGVVVIPSLWENFAYACLESLAVGQLVLASVHGGMRELLGENGEKGLLFSWEEPGSFERQLERALAVSSSDREAIRQRARQALREMCDPGRVAAQRLAHYEAVLRTPARPARFPLPERTLPVAPRLAGTELAPVGGPRISVVIPFYNLGSYLPEALESVLASDFPDFEVIVLNDGSDDAESLSVLAEIEASGDPRVRVVHQENHGLSAARNAGAEAARAPWVAFVDADDLVEPSFLRRAAWVLEQYPNVHLVASWVRFFGNDAGIWHAWNLELPYLLAHNLFIPICLVRRASYLAHARNIPEMAYGLEDFESWISLLEAGCAGIAIPEVLTRYRVRGESMFQSINRQQQMYLYRVVVDRHPELYRRYGDELFQLLLANGPAHDMDHPTLWNAPYDILSERLLRPLEAEKKKTAIQWREAVELREALHGAHLEAERQWRIGCELRERLGQLAEEYQRAQARLAELEARVAETARSREADLA